MTLPNSILYILVFIVSIAKASAEFPFAKDTFDNDGKLKEWNLQDVRLYRNETIGDIAGKEGAEKDDAAKSEKLGYSSPRVESKYFETDIDLTDVSGVVYVAIHVDDIANLTATEIDDTGGEIGTPIPFDINGSALWRAEKSYKEFPNPIPGGEKYRLKLNYTNTINLTERYNGLIDDDGVTVFLVHQGGEMKLDLKIASFQDKPDLAEDKNPDGGAANAPHEMGPGSIVLAPVEGYHTPGTRSKLTLTASTAVTGEFRLDATSLPNVEIYEAAEGGEPIPLQKTWQASEFPGTVTYYVGAKEFTPTQAAEIGRLVFSYQETSSESEALSEDKVKVTIEPAAIDAAIVRYPGDANDLPDDLDPAASALHDMDPGGIVISSIETDSGIVQGARTRLTLDVVNVPTNTGTYTLNKTGLTNLVFYTDATGNMEANLEWTDADFEGNKKVTLYLGAKPMKIREPEQSGTLTFIYKREDSSDGLTYEIVDKVKVTINTPVDIDVDSTNNEGFDFTWGDDTEDKIEASASLPGKIIAVPLNPDADKDGVPDALDGFDSRGGKLLNTQFVQMVVSIPATCDPETARAVLDYKMSDPRGLPADATIAPSGFRIWTANAEAVRCTTAIPAAATAGTGYLVPAGEEISWKNLAANCEAAKSGVYQGPAVILYIETVLTKEDGTAMSDLPFAEREPIAVTAKPENQSSEFNTSDTVNIGVRCTGGVKITGPKAIVVNDNHHNRDASGNQIDKWDYTNDRTGTLDPDVLPIAIEVTALDQDVWVTLSSEAMKGLGEPGTPVTGGLIDGVFPGESEPSGTATDTDGQSKKGWITVDPAKPFNFKVARKTTFKQNLYIEGQRHSATVDDVVIKLETTEEGIEAGDPKTCIASTEAEHKMTVYQVDLDVDSDNDKIINGSDEEDQIEVSETLPGKIIVSSLTVDSNADGIDDYQNGVDGLPPIEGSHFTPISLMLPEPYDPETTSITLKYTEAQPDGVTPLSGLRIWKLDASAERTITEDLILSEFSISWADLFNDSTNVKREVKLYIESVNISENPLVGKNQITFTAKKEESQASDSVNVILMPADIEEVISNQIAHNKCNKLPTKYYKDINNNPMLMATRSDGKAYLGLGINLGNVQRESVPEQLLVGVRQVSEREMPTESETRVAVKPKPYPEITYVDFIVLTESDDTAVRHEAVLGWDLNKDGKLQTKEVIKVFSKTPMTDKDNRFYGDNASIKDLIFIVTNKHAEFSKNKLKNDPLIWTNPGYAADFVEYFISGNRSEITDEAGSSQINEPMNIRAKGDYLAHPLGNIWGSNCLGETFEAEFYSSSELAEKIRENGVDDFLKRIANDNKNTLGSTAKSYNIEYWITIDLVDEELTFTDPGFITEYDKLDLYYALGRTRVSGQVKFKATRFKRGIMNNGNDYLDVELEYLNIQIKDTYDCAYAAPDLPRRGAIVQASHASNLLGNPEIGKVFYTKTHVYDDPEYVLPDIIEIDFK